MMNLFLLLVSCKLLIARTSPANVGIHMDERLQSVMKDLQSPRVRGEIQSPLLVLLASQSRGKSFAIDLMIGYPIGYSAIGRATLCPVRIVMRDSTTSETGLPRIAVNSKLLDHMREVSEESERHMKSLNGKFSTQELLIEIEQPNMTNLIIIDTPGFF
jgi:hypothetical protein